MTLLIAGLVYLDWGAKCISVTGGVYVFNSHSRSHVAFNNAQLKHIIQLNKERYSAESLQKSKGDGNDSESVIFPTSGPSNMGPLFTRLGRWAISNRFSRTVSIVRPLPDAKSGFRKRKKMLQQNYVKKFASPMKTITGAPASQTKAPVDLLDCYQRGQQSSAVSVGVGYPSGHLFYPLWKTTTSYTVSGFGNRQQQEQTAPSQAIEVVV
jgi:hypothetical protein